MSARRLCVLTLLVLGAAGCATHTTGHPGAAPGTGPVRTAGCATHTSPPAMSVDGTPQPANQDALSRIADRITVHAEERFADVYAGLELVPEQDRVRAFRKLSNDFDTWILRDFRADCVELVDAPHTAVELKALQDRIGDEIDYWDQHGIHILTIGARQDGTAVEVGTGDVDRARMELPRRYGTAIPIVVNREGPIQPGTGTGGP
jgi:hypothetical protein